MKGFADHDWTALAREGSVAAIYMGKKSARFIQGRLIMHGADRATPVTLVENASRPDQRILATTSGSTAHRPGRRRNGRPGPDLLWPRPAPSGQALTEFNKELA